MSGVKIPKEPPDRLGVEAALVWREVVARGALDPTVDPATLEAYCALVARWQEASRKISEEGLVVEGARGGVMVHPSIAVEQALAKQLREWGPLFNRPAPPRRKSGPMYDATKSSIAASTVLKDDKRFTGACEAVLTLAWVIDEAQRAGLDALRQAANVAIPSYLKGCAALQITPASLPAGAAAKEGKRGKLSKFEDAAATRDERARAVG